MSTPDLPELTDEELEAPMSWRRSFDLTRRKSTWAAAVLALVLGQALVGMVASSDGDVLTYDEPYHIGAAVGYVYEHDISRNWEHPPLAKLMAGLSLRLGGVNTPVEGADYSALSDLELGRATVYENSSSSSRAQLLARLPIMLFTIASGLVLFGFSRDLWGTAGALVSVSLYSLTPDILAHGHLMTTDIVVSGLLLLTLWMAWRAIQRRTFGYVVLCSAAMGLSLSAKFTALIFLVPFTLLVLYASWSRLDTLGSLQRLWRAFAELIGALAMAFGVVWMSYLVIDPSLSLDREPGPVELSADGPFALISDILPVPTAYRYGLRFAVGAQAGRPAFLFGDWYTGGSVFYYPLGLLVKLPIGLIMLSLAGLVTIVMNRRRDIAAVLLFPSALWMAFAMSSQLNIGVRHVLPLELTALVIAGASVTATWPWRWWLATFTLLAVGASCWFAFPNYISYSNEAFGGTNSTYKFLSDSSVDWGQDLERFDTWIDHNAPGEDIYFDYFGTVPLSQVRNQVRSLPENDALSQLSQGVVAISASRYSVYGPDRKRAEILGPPDAVVGGSILVWRLPSRG